MRCRASCTSVSAARPCSAAMRVSLACWSEVNCTSMSTFYRVGIAHVKREAFARVLSRNLLDNLRRLGDREKPGAMPPSHRMSPSLLDTNAIASTATPHSKRGSALALKDGHQPPVFPGLPASRDREKPGASVDCFFFCVHGGMPA